MAGIVWKDEYSVGVAEIDSDHKHLVDLINQLEEAREHNRERGQIITILDELIAYTVEHFNREEIVMQRTNYPGFALHKSRHDYLKKKVSDFYRSYVNEEVKEVSADVMRFLYNWLVYHILNDDKACGAFLNFNGYQSIYDNPQREKANLFSRLSIRWISHLALVFVFLVLASSAFAGWMFMSGIDRIGQQHRIEESAAVRKLRLADNLYLKLSRNSDSGYSEPTEISEILRIYGAHALSQEERGLLEQIHAALSVPENPDVTTQLVRELNRVAYHSFTQAKENTNSGIAQVAQLVRWSAGINAALIVALGVFGLWFGRHRLVRPLEAVTRALSGLASGDVDADVTVGRREDEIGHLVNAFKILRRAARDRNWAQQEQEQISEGIIWKRANHDHVTGLLNRTLFHDRLQHAFAIARRARQAFALLFIDLDGFKQVNDTLGHEAGDELLRAVSCRLAACIRESDTLARLGGDEFGIILTDTRDEAAAVQVTERILEQVSRPFALAKGEARIGASIGIALFPDHGQDSATLINNADSAMYAVKRSGKRNYQVYRPDPAEPSACVPHDVASGPG